MNLYPNLQLFSGGGGGDEIDEGFKRNNFYFTLYPSISFVNFNFREKLVIFTRVLSNFLRSVHLFSKKKKKEKKEYKKEKKMNE